MSAHHINPHQLQLLINPTEHISRMNYSTDTGGLYTGSTYEDSYDDYGGGWGGDYHAAGDNPAPTGTMRKLWKHKEAEALEPEGSYAHGAGMYDLIASGEQIRSPIHINMGTTPSQDEQYEGHHRVAAGHAVERDTGRPGSVWLPVRYDENYHVKRERERKEAEYSEGIEERRKRRDQNGSSPRRFSGMT